MILHCDTSWLMTHIHIDIHKPIFTRSN